MQIQLATQSDIPVIMQLERIEGYERLVGRWDARQHEREIGNPSSRYLLARDGNEIAGFAILQGLADANQCVRLRRIIVRNAGRGTGSRLLQSVLRVCFEELSAHRVDLIVHMENERARRVYARAGFAEDGILRDYHRDADGSFRSMRLMSLLRPDWTGRLPEKSR
jgi:RimJ/RimL family protein N-acetyltransferase